MPALHLSSPEIDLGSSLSQHSDKLMPPGAALSLVCVRDRLTVLSKPDLIKFPVQFHAAQERNEGLWFHDQPFSVPAWWAKSNQPHPRGLFILALIQQLVSNGGCLENVLIGHVGCCNGQLYVMCWVDHCAVGYLDFCASDIALLVVWIYDDLG